MSKGTQKKLKGQGKGKGDRWNHNREECKASCGQCVFVFSSLMIHGRCFHSTGPPQGISDHQPKHVPLTEAQRHGGRGRKAMGGFERGGAKEACSVQHVCTLCCLQELSKTE